MKRSGIAVLGILFSTMATQARADLILTVGRSVVQPEENLLFNEDGLTSQGNPVQGITNNTDEVYNIYGEEELVTPSGGQARVEATDGGFDFALIDALRPSVFFTEFEANLMLGAARSASATITACNQFGACETLIFALGSGQNTFTVQSVDPQLINTVRIDTTADLHDIRQIRLGGVQEQQPPPTPVSEPGVMGLLGLGLGMVALRARRAARPTGDRGL
jgi:hypothetical protein